MLIALILAAESIALPGGPPVGMDYLAYDAQTGLLFVPASNTGKVDVLDTKSGKLQSIDGWKTEKRGERIAGVTAATVGGGFVYVGNRADSSICAVEIKSLTRRGCVARSSQPDGVFYVGSDDIRVGGITDGTSSTLLFGERFHSDAGFDAQSQDLWPGTSPMAKWGRWG